MHAAACGDAPLPGRGDAADGQPALCKRGVQDTCGFLYPLLRLPLIFRWPLSEAFAAKNEESTDFTSVLSFLFLPWLCDCVVCRAYQCAAGLVTVVSLGNWAAPVGRHDLMPPL